MQSKHRTRGSCKTTNGYTGVSKGECVIIGGFNHGHIQWESLESAGGDDHQFLLLTQDCFLAQHILEPTRGGNVFGLTFVLLKMN